MEDDRLEQTLTRETTGADNLGGFPASLTVCEDGESTRRLGPETVGVPPAPVMTADEHAFAEYES